MADWKYYVCFGCKIREDPGHPEPKLQTCSGCQLVKFCSQECKMNSNESHAEECEKRKNDLQKLQTLIDNLSSANFPEFWGNEVPQRPQDAQDNEPQIAEDQNLEEPPMLTPPIWPGYSKNPEDWSKYSAKITKLKSKGGIWHKESRKSPEDDDTNWNYGITEATNPESVHNYARMVLKLEDETFQHAVHSGDYFEHEVALAFSEQVLVLEDVLETFECEYDKFKEQSKHLYILFMLGRREELKTFLDRLPPEWFGKYEIFRNLLLQILGNQGVESPELMTLFKEAKQNNEIRYLFDVIFNIPENLCLWTLSSLEVKEASDIGILGKMMQRVLPKEWLDHLFPIWWKMYHEPKEVDMNGDGDFTFFCANEDCSYLTYVEDTTEDVNDNNNKPLFGVKDPVMIETFDEEAQHPFDN